MTIQLQILVAKEPKDATLNLQCAWATLANLAAVKNQNASSGAALQMAIAYCDAVLKEQPTHWEARYTKALASSKTPPIFGGTTKAIQSLEALRADQEKEAKPKPEFAETYLLLGELYGAQATPEGKDKALKLYRGGLGFFPDSVELRQRIALLTK